MSGVRVALPNDEKASSWQHKITRRLPTGFIEDILLNEELVTISFEPRLGLGLEKFVEG